MGGLTGISFPFRFSPRGGVATSTTTLTDFSHLREGIEQLIRTNIYERVMEPEIGVTGASLIFEPTGIITTAVSVYKFRVQNSLSKWFPGVSLSSLNVGKDKDGNYLVDISYTIKSTGQTDSFQVPIPK